MRPPGSSFQGDEVGGWMKIPGYKKDSIPAHVWSVTEPWCWSYWVGQLALYM